MSFLEPIDATHYSYEDWIRFAFDHAASDEWWYYTEEMHFMCNPSIVLSYYARLFRNPKPDLSAYDDVQLEQGFWFVVDCQLREWLWDDKLSLDLRLECIRAMPGVFRDVFVDRPLDQACYMWWDILRNFQDSTDKRIVDCMVHALAEILDLPAEHCRISALHGFGHLEHEDKEAIIRAFLRGHPEVTEELRAYAEAAIRGELL